MKIIFKKIIVYILQIESRLVILRYKPKIIAITGSVGKTSTKDAVYGVISKFAHVRKSEKSFNSEIGLPLTILGLPNGWNSPLVWLENVLKGLWLILWPHKYPTWLVLEVGVGKPRDMARTASWLKCDAVIITAIGETPAHIEFFNSRKHLIDEKSQLINTLKKDGTLILNADDPDVLAMKSGSKHRTTTYGFNTEADVVGSGYSISYDEKDLPKGIIFRVDEGGSSLPVLVKGVFGRNHIYAALGALALSFSMKWNMLVAVEGVKNYDVSPGRMRLLYGIEGSLIIDDTYNSSPFACESALRTLGEVRHKGRRIAVLGDMLELGKHTEEAHKNVGIVAGNILKENDGILMVVGMRARAIADGAVNSKLSKKNIYEFLHSRDAAEFIKFFVKEGDLILVKGSQGIRMERVVEAILFDQKHKRKLLVRQDSEWQTR